MKSKRDKKNSGLRVRLSGFLIKELVVYQFKFKVYQLLLLLFLIVSHFLTRVYQLEAFPIFVDEAIYVRWSQVMKNEPTLRFLPLQDGKQPFFMWATIPFLKIFKNPLVAGRMLSIFSGILVLLGIIILPLVIGWSVSLGLIAGLLYVFSPYGLFFDRMALVDSLLSAFGVWSVILTFLLIDKKRLDLAMILGVVFGGALLTKSPAMFFIIMSFCLILLKSGVEIKKNGFKSVVKLIMFFSISLAISLVIYNILRLGSNFHMIALRNKDYVWSISEVIKHPLDPLKPHLQDVARYYWGYLTAPVLLLFLVGLFSAPNLSVVLLALWWLIPLLGQSSIAKVFTARYLLFGLPVLLIFAARGLVIFFQKTKIKEKSIRFILVFLILVPGLRFSHLLWSSPEKTPLPRDERVGYLEDWSSGWGIREVSEYLSHLPKNLNIIVGTEGFFGTLPEGLQIYLQGVKNVTVIGIGYPVRSLPEPLSNAKKFGDEVYLLVNKSRFIPETGFKPKLIKEYPKPGGDSLLLFEIK